MFLGLLLPLSVFFSPDEGGGSPEGAAPVSDAPVAAPEAAPEPTPEPQTLPTGAQAISDLRASLTSAVQEPAAGTPPEAAEPEAPVADPEPQAPPSLIGQPPVTAPPPAQDVAPAQPQDTAADRWGDILRDPNSTPQDREFALSRLQETYLPKQEAPPEEAPKALVSSEDFEKDAGFRSAILDRLRQSNPPVRVKDYNDNGEEITRLEGEITEDSAEFNRELKAAAQKASSDARFKELEGKLEEYKQREEQRAQDELQLRGQQIREEAGRQLKELVTGVRVVKGYEGLSDAFKNPDGSLNDARVQHIEVLSNQFDDIAQASLAGHIAPNPQGTPEEQVAYQLLSLRGAEGVSSENKIRQYEALRGRWTLTVSTQLFGGTSKAASPSSPTSDASPAPQNGAQTAAPPEAQSEQEPRDPQWADNMTMNGGAPPASGPQDPIGMADSQIRGNSQNRLSSVPSASERERILVANLIKTARQG